MAEIKRYYICAQGDTWDIIALNVYGDENYAAWLLMNNPEIKELSGGVSVYAPEISDDSGDDAPWRK